MNSLISLFTYLGMGQIASMNNVNKSRIYFSMNITCQARWSVVQFNGHLGRNLHSDARIKVTFPLNPVLPQNQSCIVSAIFKYFTHVRSRGFFVLFFCF